MNDDATRCILLDILLVPYCGAEGLLDAVDISLTVDIYSLERFMVGVCHQPKKMGRSEFMSICTNQKAACHFTSQSEGPTVSGC